MERTDRFRLRNSSSSSSSSFTVNRESIRSRTNKPFSNPSTASQSSSLSHGTQNSSKSGRSSSTHLKQQVEKNANWFSDIPNIVGTCPFMCPEAERAQRERLRDLAVFERLNRNPSQSSPSLAVKKFCRTITTKQVKPSDVRPLPVLDDTLNYLLNLMDCKEHPFEVVHDFIFDRTRSIRQDLSMQNIVNDKAVQMYEEMVKFHIISHRRLRNCSSPNTSSLHYLNTEQLMKTLISLFNLYEANRNSNLTYKNEAEFHSFYVLLHLGSNNQLLRESLSLWFRHVPFPIMSSKEMCFARNILRYFRMSNYKRFLSVIETEASYLHYCIIEPYINEVRALALSCINNCGYKLHPYPLAHLSKLLMMKESDVESVCNACGLEVCSDEEGNKLLPTKQSTFCCPKGGFQCYSFCGLEKFET